MRSHSETHILAPFSFRRHLPCPAEQFHVLPFAGKQHVVNRLVDIGGGDRLAAVARDVGLRKAPASGGRSFPKGLSMAVLRILPSLSP
jgi:hypothetical protein